MLWKSVGNWQQRRTVDLSEMWWHWPVSSKPGHYSDEQAAETLDISSSLKKKYTQWVSANIRVLV